MRRLILLSLLLCFLAVSPTQAEESSTVITGKIGGAHLEYDWLVILPTNFWFNIHDTIEVRVVKGLKSPRFEHNREKALLIVYVKSDDQKHKWLRQLELQRKNNEFPDVVPKVVNPSDEFTIVPHPLHHYGNP